MKQKSANEISRNIIFLKYTIVLGAFWAIFCCILGFPNVLLLGRGFTSTSVGISLAIGNMLGILCQPYFAGIADRSDRISLHQITALLGIVGAVCYGMMFFTPDGSVITLVFFVLADMILQTMLPLTNALSVYYINRNVKIDFGIPRGMGSLSYAILSWALGIWVVSFGVNAIVVSGAVLFLVVSLTVSSMPLVKMADSSEAADDSEKVDSSQQQEADLEENTAKKADGGKGFFAKYKSFPVMLVGFVLFFVFHNLTNTFLFQMVENVGGTSAEMGKALSLAAVLELPAMFGFAALVKHVKCANLLRISAICFAVKSIATILATNMPLLYLSQIFQMGAFALFIPSSVYYANEVMEDCDKVKGQAYVAATISLGGVLASAFGGVIIDHMGVYSMLMLGMVCAVVGAVLVLGSVKVPKEQ